MRRVIPENSFPMRRVSRVFSNVRTNEKSKCDNVRDLERYERQNSIIECVARFIFVLPLLCQRIIERRMDGDKLVVHFADKKTYTKKGNA